MTSIDPLIRLAPDRLLQGKTAIVTGASRGIGAATARAFAQAGANVVLASRDDRSISSIIEAITAGGGRAVAARTDVGDPGSVEQLVELAIDEFGRLDVAFNNAGDGHVPEPLAELAPADFDRVLRTNVRGIFLCMKYEIAAMIEAGAGGAIVNMSSTAGLSGVKGMGGYVAAKHGIIGLTKTAALDYAQQDIRVNAVAPGPIATDRIAALPEPARLQIANAVPMRRTGGPEEVAATVVWLCSDQASFITGTVVTIDGGRLSGAA